MTAQQLKKMFERRTNFDLRRLLGGKGVRSEVDSLLIPCRCGTVHAHAVAEVGRGHGNESVLAAVPQVGPVFSVQGCRSSRPGVEDEGIPPSHRLDGSSLED